MRPMPSILGLIGKNRTLLMRHLCFEGCNIALQPFKIEQDNLFPPTIWMGQRSQVRHGLAQEFPPRLGSHGFTHAAAGSSSRAPSSSRNAAAALSQVKRPVT